MELYVVGGWVRDSLLKKEGYDIDPQDRDWVVVGSTPEEMVAHGFLPVGKGFPVFLHPKTHEEYALARTERKISHGYKGFDFYTGKNVTLEEDLLRRDLTINAIAYDKSHAFVDPYNGIEDLHKKILRHVSPAFREDPVRLLRLARFSARFPDFQIASETLLFSQEIVASGEADALVPERVFQELTRALGEKKPSRFFDVLKESGYLPRVFPTWRIPNEMGPLLDKPLPADIRFGLSFAFVPAPEVKEICLRLRASAEFQEIAYLSALFRDIVARAQWHSELILDSLIRMDALRRPERFSKIMQVIQLARPEVCSSLWLAFGSSISHIDNRALMKSLRNPSEMPTALKKKRMDVIQEVMDKGIKEILQSPSEPG